MTHDQCSPPITAIIPAYQEGVRIADTIRAVRAVPGITRLLVVDDGSTDDTAAQAQAVGAEVLRLPVNVGKGAALRAGLAACPGDANDILLLLDADLGGSAGEAAHLLAPIIAGEADLTIARFPSAAGTAGFGLVKGLARVGTWLLTRQWLTAPLSGQRAARRWALTSAPFAEGYGLEVAMNIAASDAGARMREVPVAMTHQATGRNLRGFLHRGRQLTHILPALLAAALGRTGQRIYRRTHLGRQLCWAAALLLALGAYYLSAARISPAGFRVWLLPVLSGVGGVGGLLLALLGSCLLGARRKNYRGHLIPALGGLCWMPAVLALFVQRHAICAAAPIIPWASRTGRSDLPVYLPLFFLAWLVLGLVDDLWGNSERKGFRGHLHALRHGRLTTGIIKLLGGGALACGMAWVTVAPSAYYPMAVLLAVLLIALSANALNLFDLRPGRALKVWLLAGIPLFFAAASHLRLAEHGMAADVAGQYLPLALALMFLVAVLYAPLDFAGMMMLGDTGANPLGAVLGLSLTLLLPLPAQALAILLLLALHGYAERASLTRLIERVRWLRWLDELGRDA